MCATSPFDCYEGIKTKVFLQVWDKYISFCSLFFAFFGFTKVKSIIYFQLLQKNVFGKKTFFLDKTLKNIFWKNQKKKND